MHLRSAHGDAGHQYGWDPHPHRHRLPILAAGPATIAEREVGPYAGHFAEHVRPVADQIYVAPTA